MAKDKPEIIERAYQDAERWLIEVAERLERPDDLHGAYHALRCVLHTVRDNLIPDEAMDMAMQLPVLVRGVYFEGYRLAGRPVAQRTLDAFLESVGTCLESGAPDDLDPERCARAVFATLNKHLDPGQVDHVRGMLRKDLQPLWPDG